MWRAFLHYNPSPNVLLQALTAELIDVDHVNVGDAYGLYNPLQLACRVHRVDVVEWLLAHGANPNGNIAPCDMRPLREAYCAQSNRKLDSFTAVARLLFNAGALIFDPEDMRGPIGILCEMCLCGRFEVARMMINRGVNFGTSRYPDPTRYPWAAGLMTQRAHRRRAFCALGAVLLARIASKDVRARLMRNCK